MLYVKITKEETRKVGSRNYGITSIINKKTGLWETVYYCSNLVFIKNFEREKEFIEI